MVKIKAIPKTIVTFARDLPRLKKDCFDQNIFFRFDKALPKIFEKLGVSFLVENKNLV